MEKAAINGVSLTIVKGEFVVVSGRPGSGRSTFLQLLGGLLKPTSGEIKNTGAVGVVFQFPERQFFEETVYKDLSFTLRRAGIPEEEMEERVKKALTAVNMDFQPYCLMSPLELSSGEKRRVAIAAILVLDPDVIALDEPLAGLDGKGRREIVKELKRLQTEMGKTIVMATQDLEPVSKICDRIILFEDGLLSGYGSGDLIEEMVSVTSQIQSLQDALNGRGFDLGNGVLEAEEAFLRIKRGGESRIVNQ